MIKPTPKQFEFMNSTDERPLLWDTAIGAGGTTGLMLSALKYIHMPEYKAALFRQDVGWGDVMEFWGREFGATVSIEDHELKFESGSTIGFYSVTDEDLIRDVYRYAGLYFHFVGIDGIERFSEHSFRYLHSRLREFGGSDIPLRFRATRHITESWIDIVFKQEGSTC